MPSAPPAAPRVASPHPTPSPTAPPPTTQPPALPLPAGLRHPASGVAPLEAGLCAAVSRHRRGDLFLIEGQRALVRAKCEKAVKLEVSGGRYEGRVQMADGDFACEMALDEDLVGRLFGGKTASWIEAQLSSADKAARKAGREFARNANAQLSGREGSFLLGSSSMGLTIFELPPTA